MENIVKRIDDCSRITIPSEIRKSFTVEKGQSLIVGLENNQLYVRAKN